MKNNDDLTRDILKRRDEQNAKKRKIFTVSACSVCAAAAVFAGGAALAAGNGFGINVDLTSNTGDSSSYELQPGVTEMYEDKADGYTVKLLKDSDGNVTSILAIDGKGRTAEIELNLENCGLPSPNTSENYVKVKTFKLKKENEYVVMACMTPSEQEEEADDFYSAVFFALNEKSFETGQIQVYKADGSTPYYAYMVNDSCVSLDNTLYIPNLDFDSPTLPFVDWAGRSAGYGLTFDPDALSVTRSELAAVAQNSENSAVIDAPEVGLSDVHVWIVKGERPLEDGIIGDVTVILASDGKGRTAIAAVSYDDYDYDTIQLLCLDKSKGEFLILLKSSVPPVDTNSVFPYCARFYALNEKTFETGEIKPYVLKDAPEDYPAPWVTDGFEVTEQAYICHDSFPAREPFYVFDPETMTYTEKEDQPELPQNWTFTTDKIDGYYAQFTASGIAYDEDSGDITADRYEITIYAPDDRMLKIDCDEIPLIQDENGGFILLFQMFKLEQTEGEYLLVFEPPALWSAPRCNALFYAVNEKAFETGKAEQYQADPSDLYGFLLTGDCDMIAGTNTLYDSFRDGYKLTFDPETLTFTAKEASSELPESWTAYTDTVDGYHAEFTVSGIDYDLNSNDITFDKCVITVYAPDGRTLSIDWGLNLVQEEDGGFDLGFKLFKLEQTEGEYILLFETPGVTSGVFSRPFCFFAINEKAFETGKAELYQLGFTDATGVSYDDDCAIIPGSNTMCGLLNYHTGEEYTLTFDPEKLTYECRPAVFNDGDEHHEDDHHNDDHHG